MNRNIFIIGRNGFLAKAFAERFTSEGYSVGGCSGAECDLTVQGAAQKLSELIQPKSTVIICSAITPDKGKDAAAAFKNLNIGNNVAAALEQTGAEQVVYVSSDAVYSDGFEDVTESTPCDPSTLYGAGHIFREKLFSEQATRKGWPLSIIRPCAVYGPGDSHNSYGPNRFARTALKEGKITLFGEGEETRDHVYIGDLVDMVSALVAGRFNGAVNGGPGKAVSFMDVAKCVQKLVGPNVEIICQPRQSAITHKRIDNTGVRKLMPNFKATSLEEGLRAAIKDFSAV